MDELASGLDGMLELDIELSPEQKAAIDKRKAEILDKARAKRQRN